MTKPPQECPTRITSPPARSIALLVAVTSSSREVVGFCTEITSYPLSTSGLINLLQEEPSAQSPWTKTIVTFLLIEPPVCAKVLENKTKMLMNAKNINVFMILMTSTHLHESIGSGISRITRVPNAAVHLAQPKICVYAACASATAGMITARP